MLLNLHQYLINCTKAIEEGHDLSSKNVVKYLLDRYESGGLDYRPAYDPYVEVDIVSKVTKVSRGD